jgi:hypothetical protein
LFHSGCRSNVTCSTSSGRAQDVDVPKPLPLQTAQAPPELHRLVSHDVRPERAVRPGLVPLVAHVLRQPQHDRHRQHVVLPRQLDQRLARLRLHVRRVDHRQQPPRQPLAATYCSTSNASPSRPGLFSSSLTSPRQKSEDKISSA